MQAGEDVLTGTRNHNGILVFVEKWDPTPLGDSVVSLGKMVMYHCKNDKKNNPQTVRYVGLTTWKKDKIHLKLSVM